MGWASRIRLRALAYVLGISLFALGVISLTALPAWPVVGMAVACAAVAMNRLGARLEAPVCLRCGAELPQEPASEHGVACVDCGAVNAPTGAGAPDPRLVSGQAGESAEPFEA